MSYRGYLLGLTSYLIWGLSPIYFKLLGAVPASQVIAHRVLWSALLCGVLLAAWKHPGWWRRLRASPRHLGVLCGTGLLIAGNWLLYVWAINHGRMLEASLGYYINPLINVLLGMVFLGERLRRLQWIAVALAAVGVVQQIFLIGSLPWVSLLLALSFGFYGLIRKQTPVAALPGLAVETWLLVPLALLWLWLNGAVGGQPVKHWLLLALSGPVTLIPLLCFNAAARQLPYSTLAFMQYLSPTLVLLLAVALYGEPLDHSRLLSFACIWAALLVFSLDTLVLLRPAGRSPIS